MPSLLSPATLSVALFLILGHSGEALECYQCEVANCEVVTCDPTYARPTCYEARAHLKAGIYARASGCIEHGSCMSIEKNMDVIVQMAKEKYSKSGLEAVISALDLRVKAVTCCETDLCNVAKEKVEEEEQQDEDQPQHSDHEEAFKSEL